VQIQPMIATPGHGALPAAHAVEAFIVAEVIKHLVDPGAQNMDLRRVLDRGAARISVNRTVAGVHFPADSLSGAMLGQTLGEYFCARAGAGTPVQAATFDGPGVGSEDFSLGTLMELSGDDWRRKSGARIALGHHRVRAGAGELGRIGRRPWLFRGLGRVLYSAPRPSDG
jgi:hypothetical protein